MTDNQTDYRGKILSICEKHAQPGDDLEAALLAGSPQIISAEEVVRIADWLEKSADLEWGHDPRHCEIANDLRALI